MNHLSFLFDAGLKCRTASSAISAYHEYIDGKPVDQHPKICALLKGVFNKRHHNHDSCYSEGLSDKLLKLNLAVLMALTSASRVCGIHYLNIRYTW